eukprot:scaffold6655_cov169-Amphora_coffeaeformis.AAC.23
MIYKSHSIRFHPFTRQTTVYLEYLNEPFIEKLRMKMKAKHFVLERIPGFERGDASFVTFTAERMLSRSKSFPKLVW